MNSRRTRHTRIGTVLILVMSTVLGAGCTSTDPSSGERVAGDARSGGGGEGSADHVRNDAVGEVSPTPCASPSLTVDPQDENSVGLLIISGENWVGGCGTEDADGTAFDLTVQYEGAIERVSVDLDDEGSFYVPLATLRVDLGAATEVGVGHAGRRCPGTVYARLGSAVRDASFTWESPSRDC